MSRRELGAGLEVTMFGFLFRSHRVGSPMGVDVKIHGTTLGIIGFLVLMTLLQQGLTAGLALSAILLGVLACVTLHELGHIGAAALFGIGTTGLTLYPIGGIARLTREAKTSLEELIIAVAGPAVNVLLASFLALAIILTGANPFGFGILATLLWINLAMACFNMLPAYPMDGGRVLRGFLWSWVGKGKATVWAARAGQGFSVLFAIFGLATGQLVLFFIGLFILFQASSELRRGQMLSHYEEAQARGYTVDRIEAPGFVTGPGAYGQVPPRAGRVVIIRTPTGFVQRWEA